MKIDPLKRGELASREWRVYTLQILAQQSITAYMNERGKDDLVTGEIEHCGSILPVYVVDFFAVEYLATNKVNLGLEYRTFSRLTRHDKWREWKEGRKTPKEKVRELLRTRKLRKAI